MKQQEVLIQMCLKWFKDEEKEYKIKLPNDTKKAKSDDDDDNDDDNTLDILDYEMLDLL